MLFQKQLIWFQPATLLLVSEILKLQIIGISVSVSVLFNQHVLWLLSYCGLGY